MPVEQLCRARGWSAGLTGLLTGQHGGSVAQAVLIVVHLDRGNCIIDPAIDRFQMCVDDGDSSGQPPLRLSRWLLKIAKVDNDYVITSR